MAVDTTDLKQDPPMPPPMLPKKHKVFLGHPAAPFSIPEGGDPVLSSSQGILDNKLGKQSETKVFRATFSLPHTQIFYSGELLFLHNATLLFKNKYNGSKFLQEVGAVQHGQTAGLKCILVSVTKTSRERAMVLKNVNVSKRYRRGLSKVF